MARWKSFVLGALTFLVAHGVLVAAWRAWFEPAGAHAPWFLNSGRAVAFVAAALLVGSGMAAATMRADPGDTVARGAVFGGGAAVAMALVLAASSPGTLFPLALAIGAAIGLASSVAGAAAGGALRAARSRR